MQLSPKKLAMIGFVAVFVSALAFFLYTRTLRNEKQVELSSIPDPQFKKDTVIATQNISYSGNKLDVPSKLTIFAASAEDSQADIAGKLGLSEFKEDEEGKTWENIEHTKQLSLPQGDEYFSYTFSPTTPLGDPSKEKIGFDSLVDAEYAINAFLKDSNIFPQYTIEKEKVSYRTTAYEGEEEVAKERANTAEVQVNMYLENIPVRINLYRGDAATFVLNPENSIVEASVPAITLQYEEKGSLPTLSMEEALQNIKDGNKGLLTITMDSTNPFKTENIQEVTFDRVSLEYRYSTKTKYFYPFYHFTGLAKTSDGNSAEVEIATPAVRTQQE